MMQKATVFPTDFIFLQLRRISYGSYVPPLKTANNKSYKSKMTDYKCISESKGDPFIKSDEKWGDIAENPFEDDTFVYITIDNDSSSSEHANIEKDGEPSDIDDSSDADESQREGEGVTDGDIEVIDANEMKDDFSAGSHARVESLWSELGDEARQSLVEQNLAASDDYSVVTRGEYATDNGLIDVIK